MSLIDELEELEQRAREMIEGAETTEKLEAARVALMGRKGEITGLMRMMGKIEPEERPVLGKRANEMRRMAETLLDGRMKDLKRAAVRELMARSRALLFPGEEDFGIIPVEAMSAGVPVIAYGRGGATETVVDGETGLLFSEQTPESLAEALQRFEQCEGDFDPRHLHAHAKKFSTENFLTGFRHEVEAAMARM